jgi:hypothetical protein
MVDKGQEGRISFLFEDIFLKELIHPCDLSQPIPAIAVYRF